MKAKTKEGARLKRLATKYVIAEINASWSGYYSEEVEPEEMYRKAKEAKKKLFDAIDELTQIDLKPKRGYFG